MARYFDDCIVKYFDYSIDELVLGDYRDVHSIFLPSCATLEEFFYTRFGIDLEPGEN